MPPSIIGPYEILSIIGRGGIGTVYRARHAATGRAAAVKLLGPAPAVDPLAARRLAREFEALQGLQHPNIVRVFDAGVAEGYSFLAMELVEGLDLRTYLSPSLDAQALSSASALPPGPSSGGFDLGQLALEPDTESLSPVERGSPAGAQEIRAFADAADEPDTDPAARLWMTAQEEAPQPCQQVTCAPEPLPPQVLGALNRPSRMRRLEPTLRQVCQALAFIHARGFVHRDLKPSNIMVDDRRRARLMDFGLVKSMEEAGLTRSGRVVGTYLYMSPEQAQGLAVDGRSDLYSLGVILYELLCGRPPHRARAMGRLWQELSVAPPPVRAVNPDVDERLGGIADRLLRSDPDERFRTAEEVLTALSRPW